MGGIYKYSAQLLLCRRDLFLKSGSKVSQTFSPPPTELWADIVKNKRREAFYERKYTSILMSRPAYSGASRANLPAPVTKSERDIEKTST